MRQLLLILLCLLVSSAAQAIIVRHDRDEALYRELAKSFPMVCRIGGGTGTLVDARWVLTAAHVAESLPLRGGKIELAGRAYEIASKHSHPSYAIGGKHRDLALLELAEPVEGVTPARLYRESDEAGMQVTFVGDGWTGTGLTGPQEGERVLRAAHNMVEDVHPGWLIFAFDAPPGGVELEGISGPGDSGGPALVVRDGVVYVLGVSAFNEGDEACTYGTREHYSRVSDELEWLEGVMAARILTED